LTEKHRILFLQTKKTGLNYSDYYSLMSLNFVVI